MTAKPEVLGTAARSSPFSGALPGFLLLYVGLYSAYGTVSAYLPAFLRDHGLAVEWVGFVLAAGTVVRIAAGPALGRLADRRQARRGILALAAAASGLIGMAYLPAFGLLPLLAVSMTHSAATASLAPLSDALSVSAAAGPRGFQYGWVRGAGSAAFVAGTLLSGQLVDRVGFWSIIVTSSALFLLMGFFVTRVAAPLATDQTPETASTGALRALWCIPAYRCVVLVAVLVIGSHAVNDTFAVIAWRTAGYGSGLVSVLWSESVVAEVLVFLVAGPWLLVKIGPAKAAGLSAVAGVVRWAVMGTTASMPALVFAQALHGLTFALLHLAAMGIIARHVPERLAATAQTIYGTFALGIASALLTLASGYLYSWFGLHAFWAMAVLCAAALPFVAGLGEPVARSETPPA